ncbi:hypothetical protein AVEN_237500-1 [Araneus ventricosus]|uniref:Uncharacterized protein n=1 Tax=Araneus ventricosus TaxID=182803 RepID=A0A4Y2PUH7_ARAVE|nr:hypothetical protein AVEN_237500-1 [Araneus ventricosus]
MLTKSRGKTSKPKLDLNQTVIIAWRYNVSERTVAHVTSAMTHAALKAGIISSGQTSDITSTLIVGSMKLMCFNLNPCLRRRGHGQDWVRAVDYSTTQRQHSHWKRPGVLGTSNPELANQGHAMSKHSRALSHNPLSVTDPRWATPTTT